jgi:hypothetical protein
LLTRNRPSSLWWSVVVVVVVVVSEKRAVCQSLGVCRLLELNYLAGGGVRNLCFIY